MPKWLFWRSRLNGIWRLLTNRYFVVVTSNQDATKIRGRYNVNQASFRHLMRLMDVAIEGHEAEAEMDKLLSEILKRHE